MLAFWMTLTLSEASFATCSAAWPGLMMAPSSALMALLSALMVLVEVSSESILSLDRYAK